MLQKVMVYEVRDMEIWTELKGKTTSTSSPTGYGMHPLSTRTRAAVNRLGRGSLKSHDGQGYDDTRSVSDPNSGGFSIWRVPPVPLLERAFY